MLNPQHESLELSFSACVATDVEKAVALMEEFAALLHLHWDEGIRRQNFGYLVANPSYGGTWLIIIRGIASGYFVLTKGFSYEFGGLTGFVDELYIEPQFQGHNIGNLTLAYVSQLASSLGIQRLLLEVFDDESQLETFYAKAGYIRRPYRLYTKEVVIEPPKNHCS